jgi:MFS family permease
MSQQISLKNAERKAFQSTYQDGLTDMLWGLYLLFGNSSVVILYNLGVEGLKKYIPMFIIMGISILGFWAAKKYIVTPRIGTVKFGPRRVKKIKRMRFVLAVAVLATFALLLLTIAGIFNPASWQWPGWSVDLGFGIFVFLVCSFIAYTMDYPRLYLYGLLMGLSIPVSVLLEAYAGISFPIAWVISGGIILVVGLITFIRFLRRYPLPNEGPPPTEEPLSVNG